MALSNSPTGSDAKDDDVVHLHEATPGLEPKGGGLNSYQCWGDIFQEVSDMALHTNKKAQYLLYIIITFILDKEPPMQLCLIFYGSWDFTIAL
jgi:hypothetical protein